MSHKGEGLSPGAPKSNNQPPKAANRVGPSDGPGRKRIRIFGRPIGFEHWALLPLFLFVTLLTFYPLVQLVSMGFSTVTLSGGAFVWEFSGLDNFYTMLQDEVFRRALLNMLAFVAATTVGQLILGTFLAVLVDRARILSGLATNILIWPAIITPVAISVTWWLILQIEFGVLNYVLEALGLPQQAWLASSTWALWTVAVVDVWHWTPMVFLIVLAGLANIDQQLYEAARVDGASEWRVFWQIILPLLIPTLIIAAMVRAILGFKTFDEIYLLTGGGPGISSEVISTYIERVFTDQINLGYGAFLGLVVIVVLIILFAIYYLLRLLREMRNRDH